MAKLPPRTPLYQQIQDYIQQQIRTAKWQSGDKLPSEAELIEQFEVSRITVKNALGLLAEQGLIERIQGKGSFVALTARDQLVLPSAPAAEDRRFVAFMMPRIDNRFTANILGGIQAELSKADFHLLFYTTNDSKETENRILKEISALDLDGILIYPVEREIYSEEILRLAFSEFPLVVIDRYYKGVETNCVCSDNFNGAREAVEHLIQLGHNRIGFLSQEFHGTTSIEDRLSGYEKAHADNGILVDHRLRLIDMKAAQVNSLLHAGVAFPACKEQIRAFLLANPDLTAVFAVSSVIGLTLIETAEEMGRRIPEDLSVVFFDDYEMSSYSRIPPTCIRQQEHEMGQQAAKLLISLMNGTQSSFKRVLLPTELVIRQSTARV